MTVRSFCPNWLVQGESGLKLSLHYGERNIVAITKAWRQALGDPVTVRARKAHKHMVLRDLQTSDLGRANKAVV
jgi:hypothetical protein